MSRLEFFLKTAVAIFGFLVMGATRGAEALEPIASARVPGAQVLMARDALGAADREVSMLVVSYPPGGASAPHRHDAQVFVYVLEGTITMQLLGKSPVTLRTGESFYEAPEDIHVVSANASKVSPARLLVVMIKKKHAPVSTPIH